MLHRGALLRVIEFGADRAKQEMISGKRKRNIFDPTTPDPFPLSRTKLDDFVKCPRCFYLDRRLGVKKPSMPPFTLNLAVDALLKKEFDAYRKSGTPHSLMSDFGVDAVPFDHPELDIWRDNFKGVRFLHKESNFEVFGAVDDIWIKPDGTLIVLDYKSTSTTAEITLEDADEKTYKKSYKRQLEIYQWLFRRNDFKVDDTGYLVYTNALKDRPAFDKKLEFETMLISYKGDDSWIEQALINAHQCLMSSDLPGSDPECEW